MTGVHRKQNSRASGLSNEGVTNQMSKTVKSRDMELGESAGLIEMRPCND